MILIDPKMLELSIYEGIPHLLTPVVTDPMKALSALKWAVREMENRYRQMSKLGVRNIEGFNEKVEKSLERGERFVYHTGFLARDISTDWNTTAGCAEAQTVRMVAWDLYKRGKVVLCQRRVDGTSWAASQFEYIAIGI